MSHPAIQAQIDAATAYHDLFVPALFQQWAPRLIETAKLEVGDRVLDVACGTGILAREAASAVGSSGFVAGLDANAGMLAVARRLSPSIEWREGIAESLPFADGSFDAVVSQFGLMFFQNKQAGVHEMLRVLRHGGRLAVAVWDKVENSPGYNIVVELLQRIAGQQAADALRAPFSLGNREQLYELFREAASVEIQVHDGVAQFPSISILLEAEIRGWLPVMGVFLNETEIQRILVEGERELSAHLTSEGQVRFSCPSIIVTGNKPKTL